MSKPRLGIVNSASLADSYGGTQSFIRNLDPFLREAFEITYITLPDSIIGWTFFPRRLLFVLFLLTRIRRLNSMDMLVSHVPEGSWLVSFLKAPFVHIFHGNTNPMLVSRYWYGKYCFALFDLMETRIIRKARLMYTVGAARNGIPKIKNPICHAITAKSTLTRRGLFFAGRLEKAKNVDRLIAVYSKLRPDILREHPLFIAGMGTQEGALKAIAASLPPPSCVIFLGNLSNEVLLEEMSSKRILLMASSHEGFPMVIAEAFSLGLPVISTDVGDISSFLKENEQGCLLPRGFTDADYIRCIERVLGDYERFAGTALVASACFSARGVATELANDINRHLGSRRMVGDRFPMIEGDM